MKQRILLVDDRPGVLERVRCDEAPAVVRMPLTGQSDLDSATAAVTNGQILRLLLPKRSPRPHSAQAVTCPAANIESRHG